MRKRAGKTKAFDIRVADWLRDKPALRNVREKVFIEEQKVPPELEWDEFDGACLHLVAFDSEGHPVATARLLANGTIGRMAVLKEWRGMGIGRALVLRLLEEAKKRGVIRLTLHAQTHARAFYERFGFSAEGDEFPEAGISHIKMALQL